MSTHRSAARRSPAGYRTSLPWRIITGAAAYIDRRFGWDRLPVVAGLLTLLGLRVRLRQKNLYDTGRLPAINQPEPAPPSASHQVNRTADGSHNDLGEPRMGMAGTRFGRNIPLEAIVPASPEDVLARPNPREVSRALLTRDQLVPAESVNSLVAAWLQFMVRDWFSHGTSPRTGPGKFP
ncbi:peroxidase family protein [Streptomyces sp. NPDC014685]|uniref:peroxidase family protein n=1 Tax=Streptomyces sp. NPDC014685 TaxID=3364881 RepID=UPI003702985C